MENEYKKDGVVGNKKRGGRFRRTKAEVEFLKELKKTDGNYYDLNIQVLFDLITSIKKFNDVYNDFFSPENFVENLEKKLDILKKQENYDNRFVLINILSKLNSNECFDYYIEKETGLKYGKLNYIIFYFLHLLSHISVDNQGNFTNLKLLDDVIQNSLEVSKSIKIFRKCLYEKRKLQKNKNLLNK